MMSALLLSLVLSGVTVRLPMEARAAGSEVELGEIATVTGDDGQLVARVSELDLGYAPSPGYSRLFRVSKIRELLARELPGVQVAFAGQEAVRVRPEVAHVAAADIETAARKELAGAFGSSDARLQLRSAIPEVDVPIGARPWELRTRIESGTSASGIVSVPVEILVDGVAYRTVWTSWMVEVWRTQPVLVRPVKAGERLASDMFELRPVLWNEGDQQPLDVARLVGSVAARNLAPGETLAAIDVHRTYVVQAADGVFLRVRKGAIEARVPAVALEAGAVGDRIHVRTLRLGSSDPKDAQDLSATVLAHDLVEIDLGA
jgi:flagella basal body P-ring formation protein FlgA